MSFFFPLRANAFLWRLLPSAWRGPSPQVCWRLWRMRWWSPLQVMVLLFGWGGTAQAKDALTYLEALQQEAVQRELYKAPQWLRLLHYHPLTPQGSSEVRSPYFFLAEEGHRNPQRELYETLEAFFDPVWEKGDLHALCIFRGRYEWLNRQLHFDARYLPPVVCKQYETWRNMVQAQSISLVFASSFMDNPGSAFGHTFLKFNHQSGSKELNLLDHVVQFQAAIQDSVGLIYAWKGIFGGYRGVYPLDPYYIPIQSNLEFEDRSLWEYELNLTSEQIELIVTHSWEMAHFYVDYYFFLENCAYRILELIELGNPNYALKSRFSRWAIPATAVRFVREEPGLVKQTTYFPARTRQLLQKFGALSDEEQRVMLALVESPVSSPPADWSQRPPERQALILDAALDYLRSRLNREKDDALSQTKRRALLKWRSRLGSVALPSLPVIPEQPIEQGHAASRWRWGVGAHDPQHGFQEMAWRPAYHDLLADETGHLENSQMLMGDLTLRQYSGFPWAVYRFEALHMLKLAPLNLLRRDWSWRFRLGVQPSSQWRCLVCRQTQLNFSAGGSWEWHTPGHILAYAMWQGTAVYDPSYAADYWGGMGGVLGGTLAFNSAWKTSVELEFNRALLGDSHSESALRWFQRWTLATNWDMRLEWEFLTYELKPTTRSGIVAIQHYF